MPKLIPEIELRVHLAKAEEFWKQDRLDLAHEAMLRALKVGIPAGHSYNFQRTIEAEWGARAVSQQVRIHDHLILEAQPERFDWWDRLISIAIESLHRVTDVLSVSWSKPILITLFPFDDWVEFMHSRYGYYTDRETIHKVCLPPSSCANPGIFRRAATHEITHAAVRETGGEGVPRWFNEGLAVVMEGSAPAHSPVPKIRLSEISGGLESLNVDLNSPHAAHFYALAGDFVRGLIERNGIDSVRTYLTCFSNGDLDGEAFAMAFGEPQEAGEARWLAFK